MANAPVIRSMSTGPPGWASARRREPDSGWPDVGDGLGRCRAPASATTAVVTTTAISVANSRNPVRPSSNIAASAPTPTRAAARVISMRVGGDVVAPSATATPASVATPSRPGSWPKMMLTAMPVRKPTITDRDTKRMYRPRRSSAHRDQQHPGEQGQGDHRAVPALSGRSASTEPGGQRRRGRGGDHHQRGAAEQPAADLAGERRVQAVGRVDPDQQGHGHAVGHRGDGVGDAGDGVGPQVPGPGPHRRQPAGQRPANPDRDRCGRGSLVLLVPEGQIGVARVQLVRVQLVQVQLLRVQLLRVEVGRQGRRVDVRRVRVRPGSGHPGLLGHVGPTSALAPGQSKAFRPGRHRDIRVPRTQCSEGADRPGVLGPPGQFMIRRIVHADEGEPVRGRPQ